MLLRLGYGPLVCRLRGFSQILLWQAEDAVMSFVHSFASGVESACVESLQQTCSNSLAEFFPHE